MKFRHNEYCPIHRSLRCCGCELTHRPLSLQPGVRKIEDPHHPRGYRERRSPAGNAQTPEAEGQGTERNMRNLSSRVHRVQRHRAGSSGSEGDGGLLARSSGQYSSNTWVVQWGKRVNQNGWVTAHQSSTAGTDGGRLPPTSTEKAGALKAVVGPGGFHAQSCANVQRRCFTRSPKECGRDYNVGSVWAARKRYLETSEAIH
jgi:hypothetical protein